MEHPKIETGKPFSHVGLVGYQEKSVVIRTIIDRPTGYVSLYAFDADQSLERKSSPFNTLLQVVEGKAEVVICGKSNVLEAGQSIIIPLNSRSVLKATTRFKVISTTIKSGYEDTGI